jgi:hypothetical protein
MLMVVNSTLERGRTAFLDLGLPASGLQQRECAGCDEAKKAADSRGVDEKDILHILILADQP